MFCADSIYSNNTHLSDERPSGNFLPHVVVSFELQYEISAVTPVTKRSTRASQCPAGQYLVLELGNLRCKECPRGSYCPGDDIKYLCHNAPLNVSDYTATGVTTEACPFSCHAGYYRLGDTCQTVPPGYTVSPLNSSQLILCDTILPQVSANDTRQLLTPLVGTPTTNSFRQAAKIVKLSIALSCCLKTVMPGSSGCLC